MIKEVHHKFGKTKDCVKNHLYIKPWEKGGEIKGQIFVKCAKIW